MIERIANRRTRLVPPGEPSASFQKNLRGFVQRHTFTARELFQPPFKFFIESAQGKLTHRHLEVSHSVTHFESS